MIIHGHVHELRRASDKRIVMTVQLDKAIGNGQLMELNIATADAPQYLPGTEIQVHIAPSREEHGK